jgi:hypothetical protein
VSAVKAACERLMEHAAGRSGLLVLPCEDGVGLAEMVLVRRADLELLLATWGEKHSNDI